MILSKKRGFRFDDLTTLTAVASAACDSAKAEVILTDTLNSLGTCSSCGPSPYGTVTVTQASAGTRLGIHGNLGCR